MTKTTSIAALLISLIVLTFASCQSDEEIEFNRYYSSGNQLYGNNCGNCHGANGEGLNNLVPPLTDSIYLKSNAAGIPCFIKYGLKSKVTVSKRQFEGQMPATDLSPIEIAEVITYVNNSFGNKLGIIKMEKVNVCLSNCK